MDQTEANIIINMAGKGSSPRKVDLEEYGKNYDSIFNQKDKITNEPAEDLPSINKHSFAKISGFSFFDNWSYKIPRIPNIFNKEDPYYKK